MPGFVEGAGTIDFLGRVTKFFLNRKLGRDAAASFFLVEAASEEALQLLLRLTPGNDEAVETFVNAGFDEQRGFYKGGVARALAFPFIELAEDDFGDARVDDGVQAVELGAIVEDDGAEFCAVDPAVRKGHGWSEFLKDFAVGRLARLDKFMSQRVCIEDGEAHFPEHGSNRAFAAGDSTGESEP
jgi:hypothetical protein